MAPLRVKKFQATPTKKLVGFNEYRCLYLLIECYPTELVSKVLGSLFCQGSSAQYFQSKCLRCKIKKDSEIYTPPENAVDLNSRSPLSWDVMLFWQIYSISVNCAWTDWLAAWRSLLPRHPGEDLQVQWFMQATECSTSTWRCDILTHFYWT